MGHRLTRTTNKPSVLVGLSVFFFLSGLSSLFSSPCDDLPAQPGDDQKVEVTVGEMRKALCFADAYDAEHQAYLALQAKYDDLVKSYDVLWDSLDLYKAKLDRANKLIAALGGAAGGEAVGLLAFFLLAVLR